MSRRLSSRQKARRSVGLAQDARSLVTKIRREATQPKELLTALQRADWSSSWESGLRNEPLRTAVAWANNLDEGQYGKQICVKMP